MSRFLGRRRELGELVELIDSARLVTLTGAPGIGKSRLALELLTQLGGGYPGGARMVELGPVSRPVGVPRAVASALALDEVAGERLTHTITRRIGARRMLLVLDNCEHLLGACAKLVEALLSGCPQVRILATSREALAVGGEIVWQVPPLALPAPDDQAEPEVLKSFAAVELFVERAVAVQPGFALNAHVAPAVAEICRRLDGIPLAIEFAAARIDSLTADEIERRLDDRFGLLNRGTPSDLSRHETLEAALAWSYELLSDSERVLLRRLSVFAGGFEPEAAEAVCAAAGVEAAEVPELLFRLAAKSLCREPPAAETRFELLETIRAYAAERLEQSGETAQTRRAHAAFYVALAERAEPELTGADQEHWFTRLEAERPNLRAALEWSVGDARAGWTLRLAGSLVIFWYVRCLFSEGLENLQAALSAGEEQAARLRAKALWGMGFMLLMTGEADRAQPLLQESLDEFGRLGDRQGRARALLVLGNCRWHREPDAALSLFEESADLARKADDSWSLSHALSVAGMEHLQRGEPDAARALLEEAVAVARAAQDKRSLCHGLVGLGQLGFDQGDYRSADSPLEEAVKLAGELGDGYAKGWALQYLGRVLAARGDYPQARDALDAGIGLLREARPSDLIVPLVARAQVARAEGDRSHARRLLEEAVALARAGTHRPAPALLAMGELSAEEGDTRTARRLLEEGLDLARESGATVQAALALYQLGQLARSAGEAEQAEALHDEALRLRSRCANAPGIVASLEALAGLAAEAGSHCHAARLLGAAQALRNRGRYVRSPWETSLHEHDVALLRRSLSGEALEAAWAEGTRLALDEAVARASERWNGDERSGGGWSSLTEAERQVAALVADGLTNRAVGERLFIATATVRNHLSSIFAKLGVASRGELGAEVWRRRQQRPPSTSDQP